jgi:hypothetical protein
MRKDIVRNDPLHNRERPRLLESHPVIGAEDE